METPRRITIQKRDVMETPASTAKRSISSSAIKSQTRLLGLENRSPVVIEIGSRWTKYGIAGENSPRNIISSIVNNPRTGTTHHVLDTNLPENERRNVLYLFFRKVITKSLVTPANERRIVIVESLFNKAEVRQLIAKTLFEENSFQIPSLLYLPAPLMSIFPYASSTALVVDIGYHSTTVFPIYDTVVMFNAYEETDVGAKHLIQRVRDYIVKNGAVRNYDGEALPLSEDDVKRLDDLNISEDIVARFLMASPKSRGKLIQAKEHNQDYDEELQFIVPDVELPFGTKKLIVPGYIREGAAECFFTKENLADSLSIAEIIIRSIRRIPIDLRRQLLNNILLTGSPSMLYGLYGRMKMELKDLLKEEYPQMIDDVKFLQLSNESNIPRYCSWLGGSLFSDMEELNHRFYTKENYANEVPLPDWTNYIDNYKVPKVPDMIQREDVAQIMVKLSPETA